MTPYGGQDENGTDLSLIRHLLTLTPAARLLEGIEGVRTRVCSESSGGGGLKSDFQKLAELLAHHGAEFIVIGGQPETLFGSPRVTYGLRPPLRLDA